MNILFNFGCKLNQYEGFCLLKKFATSDNFIVVNTCCVTKEAEIKSLRKLKQLIRRHPRSRIIVAGCACTLYPEKFSQAHKVINNNARNLLIKGIFPTPEKARYFLKIQDGCNEFCTYCVVPYVRKRLESKPLLEIIREIEWAKSLNFQEIVLVGANIGLYGVDNGSSLFDLLKMLRNIPDLPRIRLSSIEPKFINPELIYSLKDLPFCRHFHIPIQSANNKVLLLMRRNYDASHLERSIALIQENFSDVAIGADVIVGFPFENEKEFFYTYKFIQHNPFTHLHVFPYSPRTNTIAYKYGDPVSYQEKKYRLRLLREMIQEKNYRFRKGLVGKRLNIIVEKNNSNTSGLTDNYIRVKVIEKCKERRLVAIKINEVTRDATFGSIDTIKNG